MKFSSQAKRGAPGNHVYIEECDSGRSCKRCREQVPSEQQICIASSEHIKAAQLDTSLRRSKCVPIESRNHEQGTNSDFEHWRSREIEKRPCPDRMASLQSEITPSMRATLVDWLGEVRDEFRLLSETLFLAVAYMDRFLTLRSVSRSRFQLLGLACMWVAVKFEEVVQPPHSALLAMAENMYSAEELRVMEKEVLFTLDFGLSLPTSLRFLHSLLLLAPLPAHPAAATSASHLAESVLEISLLDSRLLLGTLPSRVASAAMYLALCLVGHLEGLRAVEELSGVEPWELRKLVEMLSQLLHDAAALPQPCALLLRYRAWERLHLVGGTRSIVPRPASNLNPAARHSGTESPPQTISALCQSPTGPQVQCLNLPQSQAVYSISVSDVSLTKCVSGHIPALVPVLLTPKSSLATLLKRRTVADSGHSRAQEGACVAPSKPLRAPVDVM